MNVYWPIFVTIASGVWLGITFYRDRVSQSIEITDAIVIRLLECDKLIMEKPTIQKYISETAIQNESYFRDPARLNDDIFYQAKSFACMQLNSFDAILSHSSKTSTTFSIFKPPALAELPDWEDYIKAILRHPLYRSILNNEEEIFGESLIKFWKEYKKTTQASISADPFIW